MAATLYCCIRSTSSHQTCLSPLKCFAPSSLKTPLLSRSYRCACRAVCFRYSQLSAVLFITAAVPSSIMCQRGTMYLLDYEVLDGVPANVINGKQTYLSAPLCLLHLNQQQQLVPIAIQVSLHCRCEQWIQ